MAKLDAAKRKKIPSSQFGMPGERKYPMPDKGHAVNAKARAAQMEKKGKISMATEKKIDAKANRVIKKSGGQPNVSKAVKNIRERLNTKGRNKTEIGF